MPRKVSPLLPSSETLLRQLGDRLRLARRRRHLPAKRVAERAGMTPMTLRSLERGGTGVTIGAYLAVMQVLGIERDLDLLAQTDSTGHALQDARLSTRRKTTAPAKPSTVPNPMQRTATSVDSATTPLRQLIKNASQTQLLKLFDALPTEEMRKALEAVPETHIQKALSSLSPERMREMVDTSARAMESLRKPIQDAQNLIEKSGVLIANAPPEQLRHVFESLSTEQMRRALEALPQTPALSNLSSDQMREMVDASAEAMENLRRPIQDPQDWIEKSGFVSSQALGTLIDAEAPLSKTKRR
jgi:transcriptional regulator with XRE-family HTH domain